MNKEFQRIKDALKAFIYIIRGGGVIYNMKFTAASISSPAYKTMYLNKPYYICNSVFIGDDSKRYLTLEELKDFYKNCKCGHTKTVVMAKILGKHDD